MSFCEGCLVSQQGIHRAIEQARHDAKQFAREEKVSVVIYMDGFEARFIRADKAEGLQIVDRVTPY